MPSATRTEIRELAATARRLGVVCVFALPCYTRLLKSLLADAPHIGIGGVVGFPSGAHTTSIKVAEARQQLADGATELDMVINIGLLRSGNDQAVREDIRAVVDAAGGVPVKVILECHWLTPGQIRSGSELCVEAGAAWVKTGTGWAPTGATLENLTIIRDAVGGRAGIKAAGGVRDLVDPRGHVSTRRAPLRDQHRQRHPHPRRLRRAARRCGGVLNHPIPKAKSTPVRVSSLPQ